jgi:hypothetical protein
MVGVANMMASRGMGDIRPSKMPDAKKTARRDDTDFTQYAEGGKVGLYANINAKKKRIAKGSGEKMRKVGSKGAPTAQAFINSAKTAKK